MGKEAIEFGGIKRKHNQSIIRRPPAPCSLLGAFFTLWT